MVIQTMAVSTKRQRVMFNNEYFIETVRKYPCLYDKKCTDFKDTTLKKTIWTAIGEQFGISGDDAEKRWKNLRDRYTKERRKMRESHVSGASTSEVYFTNWSLFKYIDGFLGSVVLQADSTIGNDEPNQPTD
ncbi:transcription factor Adf-1-like [Centruroides vittatus]|uniref:transcription factor Adf-1-like n=1 Tax=Centruroides vittatus TaxID=120091 RepID=UPI0035105890